MADDQFAGLDDAVGEQLHQSQQDTAAAIRNNVQFSLDANPDAEANYQHLAKFVGVPVDTVRAQPEAIQTQAALQQLDAGGLAAQFPHTAKFLTSLDNVRKAHDDVPGMTGVEQAVKQLPAPGPSAQAPDLTEWKPPIGSRIRQWIDNAFGLPAREAARAWIQYASGQSGMTPDEARQAVGGQSEIPMQTASKFANMASFGLLPDMAGRPNTGMGEVAGGLGSLAGFVAGGPIKAADYLGERFGLQALEHAPGESFAKALARDVATQSAKLGTAGALAQTGSALDSADTSEFLSKEARAFGTNAAMGAVFGTAGRVLPDKGVVQTAARVAGVNAAMDALNGTSPTDERTLEQKVFDYGLNTLFSLRGAGRVEGGWFHDAAKAQIAGDDAAGLQALSQAAAASKLRERDPAAFRELVQNMTDDGGLSDVYVDAHTLTDALNQSGVPQDSLAQLMPEVAGQLHEALQTKGDVRIPVADYATHIAGGPLDAALLPHLKTEPDGTTYAEAQAFYQSQAESLKAQAESLAADKQADSASQADRQTVFDQVKAQLDAAGRFRPEVNTAYATLARDFYATTADRMGVKPSELFERHPLKVAAERLVGEGPQFEQGGAEREPAGPGTRTDAAEIPDETRSSTTSSDDIVERKLNEFYQGARGAYSPDTGTIALLKGADLSTFLHEAGHHFLEMTADLAGRPDAPPEIRADFEKLLDWFGVKDSDAWQRMSLDEQRPHHEQFARGFEAYLLEGKAPSVELQGLFGRFRAWLLNVYRSLTNLNVTLTPEVRGVMDRMLASEAAIREAEAVRGYRPLFESAEAAGMSPEAYADYQRLGAEATESAVEDLQRKSLRDMQWLANAKSKALKALQREAAAKRKEVRREAEAQVMNEPVYRAQTWLKRGEMTGPEGEQIKAEKGYKLDLDALKEMYPEGSLARPDLDALGRGKYGMAGKDGLHPDLVADMFGFPSGDALVRSLIEAENPREKIEALTDQRMLERHGELSDAQAIERAAEAAIHNEARARFVATELKALAKAAGPARQIAQAAKEAAEAAIAAKRVRDLRPAQYEAAEAKAARNADKALRAGDTAAAAVEKRAQLLNNRLAKTAEEAVEEVRKGVAYLKRFDKASVREGLELEYREQIDALLARYDLRTSVSGRDLNRRQSLREWYASQIDKGYNPALPDYLLDELGTSHYKDMTVEQFRGLVDAVKSIEHLGRLKQRLLDLKETRDFNAVVDDAVAQAARLPQRTPESNRGLTRVQEKWLGAKSRLRSLDASLLKMEQVFDWLDDHDANGVFNRVVFRRIADAGVRENDLRTELAGRLRDLARALPKEAQRDLMMIVDAPELIDSATGQPARFTKSQILAMALNTGNESNFAKMAAGEKWSERGIWSLLHRTMGRHDWDFVQGVWDSVESLWPEIEAMERRLGNGAPDKVIPREISTPHGTYRGGYYPVVYDPLRSFDVEQNRQRSGDQLFENNYTRATTPKGHTIARTENYARPLWLSLDVLPRHVSQVIHDIAYREAVIDADRFLADARVREAIETTLGREYYQQLRPWLQAIANDKTYDSRGLAFWDQAAHWARTNATMVGLGYRLTTMMIHGATAASNSVGEIGPRWMSSGIGAFFGSPAKMAAARDFVFERSGEMRNRMNETDRDVRDGLRELELHAAQGPMGQAARLRDAARRTAYYGISMLDMASALPTWMGAYNKGLHEGLSEQDAIYAADKAVRNAHGGGGAKDAAAIQRGAEFQKLFTMFYSFWNHFYNRQRDIARTAAGIPEKLREGDYQGARRDFGMVLARSWFYFIIPTILHAALKPPAPGQEDEHEHWAAWAAKEIALGLFSGIPVVRDLANSAFTGRDYTATPATSIVENVGRTAKDAKHAATGEPVSDKWLKHATTTAGYAFGLPTGQPASTIQFLWDVGAGKQDPRGLADWWAGVVHGDMHKH